MLVDNDSDLFALANTIEYYEDGSESLTIDDALAENFAVNFIPRNGDILHFGITSSAYWIRFDLDWSQLDYSEGKILEFGPPKLEAGLLRGGIDLFVVDEAAEEAFILFLTLGLAVTPGTCSTALLYPRRQTL